MAKAKSNVCVNFDEAVFFIPYDKLYLYQKNDDPAVIVPLADIPEKERNDYSFLSEVTQAQYEIFRTALATSLCKRCPSFIKQEDTLLKKGKRVIVENKVMQVVLEDNGWSIAVELLKKPKANHGIYQQTFLPILKNLRDALLEQFPTIYVRNGSYNATPVTQADPYTKGNEMLNLAMDEN